MTTQSRHEPTPNTHGLVQHIIQMCPSIADCTLVNHCPSLIIIGILY